MLSKRRRKPTAKAANQNTGSAHSKKRNRTGPKPLTEELKAQLTNARIAFENPAGRKKPLLQEIQWPPSKGSELGNIEGALGKLNTFIEKHAKGRSAYFKKANKQDPEGKLIQFISLTSNGKKQLEKKPIIKLHNDFVLNRLKGRSTIFDDQVCRFALLDERNKKLTTKQSDQLIEKASYDFMRADAARTIDDFDKYPLSIVATLYFYSYANYVHYKETILEKDPANDEPPKDAKPCARSRVRMFTTNSSETSDEGILTILASDEAAARSLLSLLQ